MAESSLEDEILESLWYVYEANRTATIEEIEKRRGKDINDALLEKLHEQGMIAIDRSGARVVYSFTPKGEEHTRLLIRSHRLAERLIYDILGGDFETGACEFEHITNIGLVDAICTLLGHPRECPHGLPIPEGECCRRSADTVKRAVKPLVELDIGEAARIAYVYSKDDQQLHVVEGLQIKPGSLVRVHQKSPTYVISIEDTHIAIDDEVAANIQVWADTTEFALPGPRYIHSESRWGKGKRGRGRGRPGHGLRDNAAPEE